MAAPELTGIATAAETPVPTTDVVAPPTPTPAVRYELLHELARGGMGAVHAARDHNLKRDLAVKVLHARLVEQPGLVRRFYEEATITGQLQHPGIVPIHEVGTLPDGRPFFAMKLVKGRTLADALAARPEPGHERGRWVGVLVQVAQALAYAHSKGVLHRDLKPANVMVGTFGEVQVMDWGLAKVLGTPTDPTDVPLVGSVIETTRGGTDSSVTQAGSVLGTFAYMPPEQARGQVEAIDRRSDVFGLGAMLCEVLTGQPPYVANTGRELRRLAENADLSAAQARLAACGADADLIALTQACLAVRLDERPSDAAAVAQTLADYQTSVEQRLRHAEVERATAHTRAAEERKRRRVAIWSAGLVLLFVLLAGGAAWAYNVQHQLRTQEANFQAQRLREDVEELLQSANAELAGTGPWTKATLALTQAKRRLGADGPADLQERVTQGLADLRLVERLDEIQLNKAIWTKDGFATTTAATQYEQALADAGIMRRGDEPATVAERLKGRAIKERVIVALDDWAYSICSGCRYINRVNGIVDNKHSSGIEPSVEQLQAWVFACADKSDNHPVRYKLRPWKIFSDTYIYIHKAGTTTVTLNAPHTISWNELIASDTLPITFLDNLCNEECLSGDTKLLIPLFNKLESKPADFWAAQTLAKWLQFHDRYEEALGFLRVALALRPKTYAILYEMGCCLRELGRLDEAWRSFKVAVLQSPDLPEAWEHLSEITKTTEQYRDLETLAKKIINDNTKNGRAWWALGNCSYNQKKYAEAIVQYQEALKHDSVIFRAYSPFRSILVKLEQLSGAYRAFRARSSGSQTN